MTPKQLQKLHDKWYKKLKQDGFNDIEDDQGRLKTWTGHVLHDEFAEPLPERHRESSKIHKTSQAEYYRLACQYLFDKAFPNKQYKRVWQLHSEGLSYTQIGKLMKLSKLNIQYRIRKMRILFFSRE